MATDTEVLRLVRERDLLREYDRATAIRDRLLGQVALVEKVRSDLVGKMRELLALDDADAAAAVDDGLEQLTRRDLYRLAVKHELPGRSAMNRQQLLEALRAEGVRVGGDEG